MKISENVPLSTLTTMRLGGPARYVIEIEDISDIKKAYIFAKDRNLPTFVLGGGANTIAKDDGFSGVIIKNTMTGIKSQQSSPYTYITSMGGEPWDNVVKFATDKGYTGIEALSKIPGLSGAAPVQNIGAYGQEVASAFLSAEVYDTKTDTQKTLAKDDLHFSYRHSTLNTTDTNRYFVISITLKLKNGQMSRPFYNSIEHYIDEHHITDFSPQSIRNVVSAIRGHKLPDPATTASAGSFFKNIYLTESEAATAESKGIPVYRGHDGLKINSGWLIEAAGLKGKLLHGIRVCDQAALVLINESATSYSDLAAARTEIIDTVRAKFGYTLEQEPIEL